jgi:plastocyanin
MIFTTSASAGDEAQIGVHDFFYDPAEVTMAPGAQVTWTWEEGIHDVVAVDGSFASAVGIDLVFEHTFERPGTYFYWCTVHALPSDANDEGIADGLMVGKVVVEGGEPGLWDLAVSDQTLEEGATAVAVDAATLPVDGYVVLYSDDEGAVANSDVLGVSPLLEAGSHKDITVDIDEPLEEGTVVWARLHAEAGQPGWNGPLEDWAAHDPLNGNPALGDVVAWPITLTVESSDVVDLFEGWNAVPAWPGPYIGDDAVAAYFDANIDGEWEAVAYFDGNAWLQTFADPPLPSFNTLDEIVPGWDIWLFVPADAQLTIVP